MKRPKIKDTVLQFKKPSFMKTGKKGESEFISLNIPYTRVENAYKVLAETLFKTGTERLIELDTSFVNRFEVIDHREKAPDAGRCFISRGKIELSFQDDNKTLKIFVNDRD